MRNQINFTLNDAEIEALRELCKKNGNCTPYRFSKDVLLERLYAADSNFSKKSGEKKVDVGEVVGNPHFFTPELKNFFRVADHIRKIESYLKRDTVFMLKDELDPKYDGFPQEIRKKLISLRKVRFSMATTALKHLKVEKIHHMKDKKFMRMLVNAGIGYKAGSPLDLDAWKKVIRNAEQRSGKGKREDDAGRIFRNSSKHS